MPGRSTSARAPLVMARTGILRKHVARHFAVDHSDAIDVAREAQRQVGHIEEAVVIGVGGREQGSARGSKHFAGKFAAEPVMAGRHGSVGSENAAVADGENVILPGNGAALQTRFKETQGEKRGMTFVHVEHFHGLVTDRGEGGQAAQSSKASCSSRYFWSPP